MRNTPLGPVLAGKTSSGGGEVTPESIVTATGDMTDEQKVDTRINLGAESRRLVVAVTYDNQTDEYSADHTAEEIAAAVSGGADVVAVFGEYVYTLDYYDPDSPAFDFVSAIATSIGTIVRGFNVDDTDLWTALEIFPTRTSVLSTYTPTIAAENNYIYKCNYQYVTSLTISSFPATGDWVVRFTSGSTATVLTVPNTLHMPDGFAVEANKRYEINVSDGYALVASWSTT